jgi:hypothetical protein
MDFKDKQREVIKFLLFEACAGEEIVIRVRNLYGQLHIVALQYSDGSAKFAAATKKFETKGALESLIDTKLMR